MSTAATEQLPGARAGRGRARADNDLVALATPALKVILQVRAGLVNPTIELRRTVDMMLKQLEQRGERLGYKPRQLQTVKFAIAAFVDETVLTADFPLREEWEKYPLQLEYVGEQLAGLTFYERLDGLMKNPEGEADVDIVEVYYVCLLLGYKGKYNIYFEDQLRTVINNVADFLKRAGRLRAGGLSPHWKVDDQPEPPKPQALPDWVKIGSGVGVGVLVLIYMLLVFLLTREVNNAADQLTR